jgi:uncharacterized protein (TIGR02145 family)
MELKPTNERTMRFNLSLGICLSAMVLFLPSCTDSCEDVVCLNGGACVDGDCACAEGWQGDDCSELVLQPPVPTGCEDLANVTFDGHTYDLVQIGTQCWFKENLRSDNYRNGDVIPGNLNDDQWTSTTSGAQAIYDNDNANLATYGRLYNWYAVNDARGLCPTGFHVPTDGEWTELVNYLGGEQVAGTALKASAADTPAWDGTNSSGFSALPGGFRDYYGYFLNLGNYGGWWSSSPSGSFAWNRGLYPGYSDVGRPTHGVREGFSVRCVRD